MIFSTNKSMHKNKMIRYEISDVCSTVHNKKNRPPKKITNIVGYFVARENHHFNDKRW